MIVEKLIEMLQDLPPDANVVIEGEGETCWSARNVTEDERGAFVMLLRGKKQFPVVEEAATAPKREAMCSEYVGPEGERCAKPAPCAEHQIPKAGQMPSVAPAWDAPDDTGRAMSHVGVWARRPISQEWIDDLKKDFKAVREDERRRAAPSSSTALVGTGDARDVWLTGEVNRLRTENEALRVAGSMPLDEVQALVDFERKAECERVIAWCVAWVDDAEGHGCADALAVDAAAQFTSPEQEKP